MTATTANVTDLEAILPEGQELKIDGVLCTVRHLKAREFFALMGILTNGLGSAVGMMGLNASSTPEDLGAKLGVAFIMALPNQGEQFIQFVKLIVEPSGSPEEIRRVQMALDNPELDDLLPILDAVVVNEQENVFELMGKARAYLKKWTAMVKGAGQ